jgi:hypothetical protein
VAVAVDVGPQLVLDENLQIVESTAAARAETGAENGQSVLAAFPGSQRVLVPQLERARRTGETVAFPLYLHGSVTDLTVVPAERSLTLSWERICSLDVLTLDGLRASLESALEALQAREDALHRDVVRRSLRVLDGGRA